MPVPDESVAYGVHGAQVYRACQMGYWRASKRWCKQLPSETVNKALAIFANNEAGLRPSDIYAGPSGAIAQLQQLAAWFQVGSDCLCQPCHQASSASFLDPSGHPKRKVIGVSAYTQPLLCCEHECRCQMPKGHEPLLGWPLTCLGSVKVHC